jgi:hypothetical protein
MTPRQIKLRSLCCFPRQSYGVHFNSAQDAGFFRPLADAGFDPPKCQAEIDRKSELHDWI